MVCELEVEDERGKKMLTLLAACSFTNLAVVASSEENPPYAALEWQPVVWFVVYSSATLLLLLLVTVTCAIRRERIYSKGLLGVDLVERGVLHGEKSGGLCEWLSRCWPWSPAPQRTPQLSHLRVGLSRSTQPLLCYQLVEKRHVHLARGALCVIRTDLKELQELAEQENVSRTSRGSRDSGELPLRTSSETHRGSGSGSPRVWLGSVVDKTIVQVGTVKPVDSSNQPLFRKVKRFGSSDQRVSWSQSAENITSGAEILEEGGVGEPLPKNIPTDLVITVDNTQSSDEITDTVSPCDVKHMEKWGTASATTRLGKTTDTGGSDESQPPVTVTEEITHVGDHFTPFKNDVKSKSYTDINREEGKKTEHTITLEGTQAKRDVMSLQKEESATDLEQTSESDVLDEISGSSDDFPTYLSSDNQSQEHDFMFVDNIELDREFKTLRYISSATGDPEPSPSQKEVPTAFENTIKQSPSVYLCKGKDASNIPKDSLPKHSLPKEEMEDTDVSENVSSCFLHPIAPHSQQEDFQSNKHNSSKSVQYVFLHPEKENSAKHLQYWQQTEYKIAPASVITANNAAFSASTTTTKRENAKSSEKNVAAEEVSGLQTSWDLLHSFPCHTGIVQMEKMDTTSKLNTVSDSYSGFNQHDEHSLYQRWKGDDVQATQQQVSCDMEGIIPESRHKCLRADQHTSTILQPPSSFRSAFTPVSYSETTTKQQHHPLTTTTNTGERHRVLQWKITVSPRLVSSSKGPTKIPDQRPNEH